MKHWHVVQAKRGREIKASVDVARHGFEAYLPMMLKRVRRGLKLDAVNVPRFPPYLFARFDANFDDWGRICFDGAVPVRNVVRVFCDALGHPRSVPDEAMEAMRSFEPPADSDPAPIVYAPGQSVLVYIGGVSQQAVFVGYERKKPIIRVWILGHERIVPVLASQLEPQEQLLTKKAC